jgi:hypothetical protein
VRPSFSSLRRPPAVLAACACLAVALACAALAASPAAARVTSLSVNDDSAAWYPGSGLVLRWSYAEPTQERVVLTAFGYRLLDPMGNEVARDRVAASARLTTTNLPPRPGGLAPAPGLYTVELWAYERHGQSAGSPEAAGPSVAREFGFDDQPPGPVSPVPASAWVRGDEEVVLQISGPAEPLPISGLRGYAFSVRGDTPAPPCAGAELCTDQETDLGGGIADNTIRLGLMPEGRHHVSAVAVANTGLRSAAAGTAVVGVDASLPDIALSGTDGGWSDQPVRVRALATDALSGMRADGITGPRMTLVLDGGTPLVAAGAQVATTVSGSGVHQVAASARDAVGHVRGEDSGVPPVTGVVRIDETPPALAFVRGGEATAPELIEATIADPLSGPAPRGTIAVRRLGSGQPFEPLPTLATPGRLSARWDSDAYPEGSYEFRVTGHDHAGNTASSGARDNSTPMVLLNPVKARTALRFGFGAKRLIWHRCVRKGEGRRCRREVVESFGRRPASRTIPYGQRLQVAGRLETASGGPLGSRPIELVEVFAPGAGIESRVTRLQTAADGSFLARLSPGPSRRLEARFPGSPLLTRAASPRLELGVRSLVRLRASAARAAVGGAPVVFSGRVGATEARIPKYGRPVQLQFRLPGVLWTEFRTVQTDAHGRFRFPYSLTDDDSRGVRFLFRAYAPPQPGWPYEPAASLPVAVTGR